MGASITRATTPTAPIDLHEFASLPPRFLERLAAEGVLTLADWRALGPRRLAIFGVTPRVVREIDALARGARSRS